MIVRCTSCNSAFAVDDAKVNDKKFAFTCPKCENENVIDNRKRSQPTFAGPAIVDEAYEEKKPAELKETVMGTGKEDYFREVKQPKRSDHSAEKDMGSADKPLFDDLTLSDTDDLSGLAEPEQLEETGTSIETTELPPADDMRSEIPLDDMTLDDELEDLDISNRKRGAEEKAIGSKPTAVGEISGKTTFEELGEELDDFKSDSGLIHDEMDTHDDAGEPVELEEIDDIDKLLEEDGKEREIIDDFEPLEDETMNAVSKSSDLDIALNEEIKTEEMYRAEDKKDDESITIDLDTLDIDLDDSQEEIVKKPNIASGAMRSDMTKSPAAAAVAADDDENIRIDLDSLDIELQDEKEILKGENHEELGLDLSDFSE
jgi:hypothetical protein